MSHNILKNKFVFYLFIFICVSFFAFRLKNIDKDLPNYGISFYQSKDEGNYSQMAIMYNKYCSFHDDGNGTELTIHPTFRTNILGNLAQIFSLKIFGNNYFGFRLPYFIFSLLIFLFTFFALNYFKNKYNNNKSEIVLLLFLIMLCMDFPVLVMSRCVENSSLRGLFLIASLLLFIKTKKISYKYFFLGMLSIISVFEVYFSNVTLLLSSILLFVYIFFKEPKKFIYKLSFFIFGCFVGFVFSEIYYRIVWESGCVFNFRHSIFAFSDRISSSGNESIITFLKSFLMNSLNLFGSNMFFYNFVIGILFWVALVFNVVSLVKRYDEEETMIIMLQLAYIIQSVLTNDYAERKSIMIYPIILINIYIFLNKKIKNNNQIKKYEIIIAILGSAYILTASVYLRTQNGYFLDFDIQDKKILVIFTSMQIIVFIAFLLNKKNFLKYFIISVIFVCTTNAFFDAKYVYFYNSYSEKEAMIGIGNYAKDSYVGGLYSYSFSLYNDIKPLWNSESLLEEEILNGKVKLFCDYSSGPYFVEWMNPDGNYRLVQEWERALEASGEKYPIGLFERTMK